MNPGESGRIPCVSQNEPFKLNIQHMKICFEIKIKNYKCRIIDEKKSKTEDYGPGNFLQTGRDL